jgi:hypothetical protein
MFSRFSSPAESTVEVGSRIVALHTFSKVDMNIAFCKSIVGDAFVETTGEDPKIGMSYLDIPDQPYPQISSDPPMSVAEHFTAVHHHSTKIWYVALAVRVTSQCS